MFEKLLLFFMAYIVQVDIAMAQQARPSPQKATKIIIIETGGGFVASSHEFTITHDSIIVQFIEDVENGNIKSRYAKAINSNIFNNLSAPFHKIYLSQIKSSYEGPSLMNHDWSYYVAITKGEYVKETQIYKYKLVPLLLLCKKLNMLLPKEFNISYTKTYLEDKY